MAIVLSAEQTRQLRMRAQRLVTDPVESEDSPVQVVRDIIGVQAQDLAAAQLSMRVRSAGLTVEQIERARLIDRALAWTWCMRGTLHLLAAEDAAWLIPFLGPGFIAADRRRMQQLGWNEDSAASGIQLLKSALADSGELDRSEIVRILHQAGLPNEGQAPFHLLYRAGLEGILCWGPGPANKPRFVGFEDWIGKLRPLPRTECLAILARRYLEAYAPANPKDLASWSGLKISDAHQAFQLLEGELLEVQAAGQPVWMFENQLSWLERASVAAPVVRLMPRYDTYWMGYAQRDLIVEAKFARRIHPGGGVIHPFLLVNGRASGTWSTRRRENVLEVRITPFEELAAEIHPWIEAEAADLGRFLGIETALLPHEQASPGGK